MLYNGNRLQGRKWLTLETWLDSRDWTEKGWQQIGKTKFSKTLGKIQSPDTVLGREQAWVEDSNNPEIANQRESGNWHDNLAMTVSPGVA